MPYVYSYAIFAAGHMQRTEIVVPCGSETESFATLPTCPSLPSSSSPSPLQAQREAEERVISTCKFKVKVMAGIVAEC